MIPDLWQSLLNSFFNGSVVNYPSSTYLWLAAKRNQHKLTIPLQVWCMAIAVCLDHCFIWLSWLPATLAAIWPNSLIKSSWLLFRDLISACRESLCSLSIWRVFTFKIFHHIETLLMKMAVSFLSALIPNWIFLKTL